MAKWKNLLLCLSVFVESALAQTCSTYKYLGNQFFESCNDLPVIDSFLHYTYHSSSGNLQIAYHHTKLTSEKWVAWAMNPTLTDMVGAQAIVAYPQSDGIVRAYTSPITSYQTSLQEEDLSFNVSELSNFYQNNEMVIFATLNLPLSNGGIINIVWQDGPLSGNIPLSHPTSSDKVRSVSNLNLISGALGSDAKLCKRNIHGILNGVSWGIMMPIGTVIARYLRVAKSAESAWFYLHVFCKSSAYIIGVDGWTTGLILGGKSSELDYDNHGDIGIALFNLATVHVFEIFPRLKPYHKYRVYWNIYHHTIGYTVIILAGVNIFEGLNILNPEKQWRNAYTVIIMTLALVAVVLEAFTWYVVIVRI